MEQGQQSIEWFEFKEWVEENSGMVVRVSRAGGYFPRRFSLAVGMRRPDGSLKFHLPVYTRDRNRQLIEVSFDWMCWALREAQEAINQAAREDEEQVRQEGGGKVETRAVNTRPGNGRGNGNGGGDERRPMRRGKPDRRQQSSGRRDSYDRE